jgi:hypothetical protein
VVRYRGLTLVAEAPHFLGRTDGGHGEQVTAEEIDDATPP